jgi:hypothetical protein
MMRRVFANEQAEGCHPVLLVLKVTLRHGQLVQIRKQSRVFCTDARCFTHVMQPS